MNMPLCMVVCACPMQGPDYMASIVLHPLSYCLDVPRLHSSTGACWECSTQEEGSFPSYSCSFKRANPLESVGDITSRSSLLSHQSGQAGFAVLAFHVAHPPPPRKEALTSRCSIQVRTCVAMPLCACPGKALSKVWACSAWALLHSMLQLLPAGECDMTRVLVSKMHASGAQCLQQESRMVLRHHDKTCLWWHDDRMIHVAASNLA